jgi:serine O-acetyltransferase
MPRDFHTSLLYARSLPVFGKLAYCALKVLGVEVPRSVRIGKDCLLEHGGFGVVIHSKAVIGNRVKIYPNVTVGRADIYKPIEESRFEGIVVEDDVILCPGARILCKEGVLRVGKGTVVGANAVLLNSTGEGEIWAGIPAKKVGEREHASSAVRPGEVGARTENALR